MRRQSHRWILALSVSGHLLSTTACAVREQTLPTPPAAYDHAQLSAPSATLAPPTPTATSEPTATLTPRPSATPRPTATPNPRIPLPDIDAYSAYVVEDGDTLASISAKGGSDPELLRRYNRLRAEPRKGQAIIVPHLAGRAQRLAEEMPVIERGPKTRPWIALTFDCGGDEPRAHELLDVLKAANVRVTFFILGESIERDPALLRRIVADGHELASHSFTHRDFTKLSTEAINQELRQTAGMLDSLAGQPVWDRPYVRLPYGAYSDHALMTVIRAGYLPVHWSLDSWDAFGEPKVAQHIITRLTAVQSLEEMRGGIVLTHCSEPTIEAMPEVLRRYRTLGLEVRPLSEVLGP